MNEDVGPVNEETAGAEVAGAKVIPGSVVPGDDPVPAAEPVGYDETAGISYEAQPRGFEIPAPDAGPGPADEPPPAAEPPAADEPPTLEQTTVGDLPLHPADEPRPEWNQTMASAPRPVETDRGSRGNPFGRILGLRGGGARADGGPQLTRVRDLPFDWKMRIWRMRALIVVIVGVVFTIITRSWAIGVTLAILAGIADTIYRSRTVEAHHAVQAGTVDRAAWRAQKQTRRQLASMERAGYLALNRRPIPDSVEVIDHLVVGPTGVYAIDSEKWAKDLPIRQRNSKQLYLGPESKKDRLDHAKWEAGQAAERLSAVLGTEITVQPALAIYGPKISWVVLAVRGVDVFSGSKLKKYLNGRARRKDAEHLTEEQIQKIYQAAADVLPLEWQKAATPVG